MPRSRFLWLVRDGRDVVDSSLDAVRPGAWGASTAVLDPSDAGLRRQAITDFAEQWVQRTQITRDAFSRHDPTRRMLVRYEDLLADTAGVVADIVQWLELPPFENIDSVVGPRSYGSLPENAKGAGRFVRAASPGLWREHFDATEAALLTDLMAADLSALGYD